MIAPRKDEPNTVTGETGLRRARRVAAAVLVAATRRPVAPPSAPAWQAWALVGWMLTVTGAYVWMMVAAVYR